MIIIKIRITESSLVVQWLRLHDLNAGGPSLIPGQGTRSHIPQQRVTIPCATTKTWHSQINNFVKKKKKIRITDTSIIKCLVKKGQAASEVFDIRYHTEEKWLQ